MADDEEEDPSVLEDLLSTSDQLKTLESLDAAFTTNNGSFTERHVSDSVDIELDLPEVVNMPSLESILNEKDEDILSLEDDPDLANLIDNELLSSTLDLNQSTEMKQKKSKHGFVLRQVVLKNVSGQMVSASARVDAGLPTAMAVSSLICIGTSHGVVLVFDPQQTLKLVLGNTSIGAEYGAVTALGINMECTRVLCGHARGQITMWDLQTGKLLRSIPDAHPQGSAVLHVVFTDDPSVAICSDSGGSVFVLTFKRLIGVRSYESTCLFSGCRGEVCTMAPLHLHEGMKDHPLYEQSLLALATLTKVLILTLKPELEVLFTHTLKGSVDSLPLLAWQFAIIQVASKKVIDPVVAFARGTEIYFYQTHCKAEKQVRFVFLQKIETAYKLIALDWLNPQVIAAVDTLERVHVMDVRSMEELEVLDLNAVQLVYSSSYFKSLSTGGNVSKALVAASEHSCYQTIRVFNGQLLLLGVKSVHVLTLRSWQDRIEVFVKQNNFLDALELALSFYNGTAMAVVGLAGNKEQKTAEIAGQIEELLLAFVDITVFVSCPKTKDVEELKTYFKEMVPVFIKYCIAIKNMDLLFREIYDKFCEDPVGKVVFLESLEPHILSDKLTSLSPIVMKEFIEHYQQQNKLREVESCLMHLDVTNLDIHQMVKLCWAHGLFDAIFYVYNRGMHDYTTPLEDLINVLKNTVQSGQLVLGSDLSLGNKLLVYISCCLAGQGYPVGSIPEDLAQEVKRKIFNCITARSTKDDSETELSYPRLRVLLQFDTQEFLNVLSMAFERKDFDNNFEVPNGVTRRQYLVNILLDVMVQDTGFSPSQVGSLFTFLARQMAKKENRLQVNKILFEQVLEYLSNPDDDSRHEERQQALLELWNAGGLQQFDDARILVLAENAKFYRVCEMLYEKKRQFPKVLSCYFRDSYRAHQVFAYVHYVMTEDVYTELEREELKEASLNSLQSFLSIDCGKTANMIVTEFPDALTVVVRQLEGQSATQYEFLKGVFDNKTPAPTRPEYSPAAEVHEKYIELMCKYQPDLVHSYLRNSENYRLEETLAIVRQFNNRFATAYLLEKAGDITGAFQLLLETLKVKVKTLCDTFEKHEFPPPNEIRKLTANVEATLLGVLIPLCQRNSGRLEEADREALWFPLLETVMAPQRKCKDTTSAYFVAFKEQTRHVLNSMMGYISLPAILQKIMQDPTYNTGKFGEIKELILGMLDTYSYESTLLKTTNKLLAGDLHSSLSNLKKQSVYGFIPKSFRCAICHRVFIEEFDSGQRDDLIVYRCGHVYHSECMAGTSGAEGNWICLLCNKTGLSRLSSGKGKTPLGKLAKPSPVAAKKYETAGASAKEPSQKTEKDIASLTQQQFEAIARLKTQSKGASRFAILSELSKPGDAFSLGYGSRPNQSSSIFEDERFRLHLAPPR
ncbi:vacuolar protein sorting-associated protein 8 homolog isoform X3 [Acropora millepora]|uniref:vacuolar protein sorting-associated protein 8 homolog isoform X1 n=1 Tax=Acropora millepora TaxID=45264 RepID=UPI001CF2FEC9|nr:vacuolar protein sorting-associated protein 8 homolog isoform X1 [Acropora millepora]XP_044183575.1 vacuolar protein sorting-associated protein 8 homolog isoform X2 [Acropora millepora]XP_044183576.1 vacuolar protein sorting-associated protein 8 homolog isoform X3 [Acropora millepora]